MTKHESKSKQDARRIAKALNAIRDKDIEFGWMEQVDVRTQIQVDRFKDEIADWIKE